MTLNELKLKHDRLKKLDGGTFFKGGTYKTFGSDTHRYKFNLCLSAGTLNNFENTHSIILPSDYKTFLTEIGNGGSGPAYGLFALLDWDYQLQIDNNNFLSINFPHTQEWNDTYNLSTEDEDYNITEQYQKWEEAYFLNRHITGSMRICHYGCAIYYLLVVTGNEAGHIWIDDRSSDGGIYPAISQTTGQKLTFSDWYNEWLNDSLKQFM